MAEYKIVDTGKTINFLKDSKHKLIDDSRELIDDILSNYFGIKNTDGFENGFRGGFVLVEDGEYKEVYLFKGLVPDLNKRLYQVVETKKIIAPENFDNWYAYKNSK